MVPSLSYLSVFQSVCLYPRSWLCAASRMPSKHPPPSRQQENKERRRRRRRWLCLHNEQEDLKRGCRIIVMRSALMCHVWVSSPRLHKHPNQVDGGETGGEDRTSRPDNGMALSGYDEYASTLELASLVPQAHKNHNYRVV